MTVRDKDERSAAAGRRFGYGVAVGLNVLLLLGVNVWPGWQAVPFLTEDTSLVIGLVNVSIAANLAVNLVYLFRDDSWLKALGDLLTLGIGLVALVRFWQVFPFDFGAATFDWALVVRVLLGLGVFGSVVGLLVACVRLGRSVHHGGTARPAAG
jgi:hypothetical protein